MFFNLFHPAFPCALCGRPHPEPVCALCRAELDDHHRVHGSLCRCALPNPGGRPGELCGRCLDRPPPFRAAYTAWWYEFPVDGLLNGYKHRGRLDLEHALHRLVLDAPLPWPEADCLCPLPSHWRRTLGRGFDQAERLAAALARPWQRPLARLLRRRRATARQQGGSRAHRLRNLSGAFQAAPDSRGRRVLLIDDVLTTGASARAASAALLDAGAREVRVWTLARTPDASRAPPEA